MHRRTTYRTIEEHLRVRIATGIIKYGDKLPSFEQLRLQFGAASNTVVKAYDALERDGLVERRKRKGIYAAYAKPKAVRTRLAATGINPGYMDTQYWTEFLQGLRQAGEDRDVDVVYVNASDACDFSTCAGVINIAGVSSVTAACPPNLPMVCTHNMVPSHANVSVNEYDAGFIAADYLIRLGHRRIGYLAWPSNPPGEMRLAGYHTALGQARISRDDRLSYWLAHRTSGTLVDLATQNMHGWFEDGFRRLGCTAIIAQNDWVALGTITALIERGFRVPEDVSVVGFDHEPIAADPDITITSITGDMFALGYTAVETLVERIGAPVVSPPRTILLPVEIFPGRSTASPWAGDSASSLRPLYALPPAAASRSSKAE